MGVCKVYTNFKERQGGVNVKERVEAVLAKIRPAIQADGGDVELVGISEDNVVTVRLTGACVGCPMSELTLKGGIERILKHEIPEVASVESAR
ncbi:MAG: NifU family protein [Firmicutes bacterium]|jgi:Fe-S cluster biogenesis protein NfuA|nr:NifU family protein [Bacillota bacterium]